LIEKTGAIDVYFEDEIEILVADPEAFNVEALEGVLEANEIEYTRVAHSKES